MTVPSGTIVAQYADGRTPPWRCVAPGSRAARASRGAAGGGDGGGRGCAAPRDARAARVPGATQHQGGVRPSAYCATIVPLGTVMGRPGPPADPPASYRT